MKNFTIIITYFFFSVDQLFIACLAFLSLKYRSAAALLVCVALPPYSHTHKFRADRVPATFYTLPLIPSILRLGPRGMQIP